MKYRMLCILLCPGILLLSSCTGTKTTQSGGATLTQEPTPSTEQQTEKKRVTFKDVESNDITYCISQAKELQAMDQLKKAVSHLRKAKQLKPDSLEIRETLVSLYKEMALPDYEIIELKELIGKKPENVLRVRCAALLREKEVFDEAINIIEDIRAVDPEDIAALLELGQIYKDQKMYTEAIETFREISYIDAKNALTKYYQAEVYLEQNKPLWADKYYKDALKIDPTMGLAVYGLAKIAKIRNSQEEFQKHLARAYELSPDAPEIKRAYMEQ